MRNAITWSASPPTLASPLERNLAAVGLALLLVLNVVLIGWWVSGVPVRGLVAGALMCAVLVAYPQRMMQAITKFAPVLWLGAGLALLGAVVSLANGTGLVEIFVAITEVHIQVAITLLVAVVLSDVAGMRVAAMTFVAVIGFSVLIGLLQFIEVEGAWNLREALGRFQDEEVHLKDAFIHGRPLGLAFSPIQFSTHACLAFAVFAIVREKYQLATWGKAEADFAILVAIGILCMSALISGTRSPILGAALFMLIYAVRRPGSTLILLVVFGGAIVALIGPLLLEILQTAQPRILRTDDNSATGRESLFTYGLMLFINNPLGYGFEFTPSDHWQKYWQEIYTLTNPSGIRTAELHNYLLNMMNVYGIGLIIFLPLIYALLKRARYVLIFFIPYIIHIMFHNSGPFWNDTIFWFAVAALALPLGQLDSEQSNQ
ncbi:MAG: O-antigen ligase family protein [Erythrobacter sp.]|nr:O-antigen ligase family protein [Erythrobacter sp.]